jgi:hypothetical protein
MAPVTTLDQPRADASQTAEAAPAAPVRHRRVGLDWVFTAIFGVFGWATGLAKLTDNSFFWHLRTGQYILDHGFPHHDIYSYTAPGTKWVAQSWLAEVAYALTQRAFGDVGIRLLVATVGAVILMLTYRLARRLVRHRLMGANLAAVALLGTYVVWSERPLLFGLLCLVVLLWVVEVPGSWVGRRPLVALPVLMWLWANTHGTFELGFAYLGLHLLGRWLDGHRPWEGRERTLLLGSLVALAVTFVNPYGVSLVTFPIQLLSRGEILSHIVEWKSPSFRSAAGIGLALWGAVFVLAVARGRHRTSRRDLLVALPMLFLALWAVRNVAIAPLIGLPIACRAFARDTDAADGVSSRIVAVAVAVLVVAGGLMGLEATQEQAFDFSGFPVKALAYVKTHDGLGGRLLTNDAAAGYVILREWPQQRVFIDDRYDMYPTGLIHDYFGLATGSPGWNMVLDHFRVQTVVWKRASPLASLLDESPAWHRVYRDDVNAVWERVGQQS